MIDDVFPTITDTEVLKCIASLVHEASTHRAPVHLITSDLSFLTEPSSVYGKAILGNIGVQFLFNQAMSGDIDMLRELYTLNASDCQMLSSQGIGESFLQLNAQKKAPVKHIASILKM